MQLFALQLNEYQPISVGDGYLYQYYDKIISYSRNVDNKYSHLLAKPILNNGIIEWHGAGSESFSRIGDRSKEEQERIKRQYWDFKSKIDVEILDLKESLNPEKQKWGTLLSQVFDDENNVIITDGRMWSLLWGWKFRNKVENYLAPVFDAPGKVPETPEIETASSNPSPAPAAETNQIFDVQEEKVPLVSNVVPERNNRVRPGFWFRVKRFLRLFVYRFWGLMSFILMLMFLFCLLQKCTNSDCPPDSTLNNKLNELERKVRDCCK